MDNSYLTPSIMDTDIKDGTTISVSRNNFLFPSIIIRICLHEIRLLLPPSTGILIKKFVVLCGIRNTLLRDHGKYLRQKSSLRLQTITACKNNVMTTILQHYKFKWQLSTIYNNT